ncbi:MAG: MerR family transcriptional regulator [Candidatus Onthomonas sp.]
MTIKEIEARSGMTRANIRFYEAEGLLSPLREANGYRNYSEADLELLLRIKLLRTLGLSLEEIRSLSQGEEELTAALDRRLVQLSREQAERARAESVCRSMRQDNVRFETLNAQRYLDAYVSGPEQARPAADALAGDQLPKVRSPWRRYFARSFDLLLCGVLWNAVLGMGLNINVLNRAVGWQIVDGVVELVLLLLLEPLFLTLLGATPGKWLLGLRVTDQNDRHLSYQAAFTRTCWVLWKGLGFTIVIYDLVRLWKSYKACQAGETLEWEYESDSVLTLRDERPWRSAALAAAFALVIGIQVLTARTAGMARNRGAITVAEFCENYNRLAAYYEVETGYYLDSQGSWLAEEQESGVFVIQLGGELVPPEYRFTEEDGAMTGMEFTVTLENSDVWASGYQDEMTLSTLSFVGAQADCLPLDGELQALIRQISEHPFEDFQETLHGVTVTCAVDYSGYFDTGGGMLIPDEDVETAYRFHFSMERTDKR